MRRRIAGWLGACALLVATGARAAPLAAPCTLGTDCDSGFCADGVCCDRACDATCEACRAELKQSGRATGTCGVVRAGTDPDDDCAPEAKTSCGQTGNCDGLKAACALWPLGTPCHDPPDTSCQCNNTTGWICSGAGTCNQQTTFVACGSGDYACLRSDGLPIDCTSPHPGACANPCGADSDCLRNYHCSGGACVAKLTVGARCTGDFDCALPGHCADGYCCDQACNRQCEACDRAGSEGKCTQVAGQPIAPRADCTGAPPCKGACTTMRDACDYPGNAVVCGTASCVGDSVKPADTCDATGKCAPGVAHDCGDYTCDPTALDCFTSCTTSLQCAGTEQCDRGAGRGTCRPAGATCSGIWSAKAADGTISYCKGYQCTGAGVCSQRCSSPVDCDTGYSCASDRCVPASDAGGSDAAGDSAAEGSTSTPPDGSAAGVASDSGEPPGAAKMGSDSGCGCHTASRRSPPGAALCLLALAVGLSRRSARARGPTRCSAASRGGSGATRCCSE